MIRLLHIYKYTSACLLTNHYEKVTNKTTIYAHQEPSVLSTIIIF